MNRKNRHEFLILESNLMITILYQDIQTLLNWAKFFQNLQNILNEHESLSLLVFQEFKVIGDFPEFLEGFQSSMVPQDLSQVFLVVFLLSVERFQKCLAVIEKDDHAIGTINLLIQDNMRELFQRFLRFMLFHQLRQVQLQKVAILVIVLF